jgi:hypothetical protein
VRAPIGILEPAIDRYLDERGLDARRKLLDPLVSRLCESGDVAGVQRLDALLARRTKAGRVVPALPGPYAACANPARL